MANKVIGIRKVDYDRKSDGRHVEGIEVVYTYESKRYEGLCADKQFIGMGTIDRMGGEVLCVGDEFTFTYGRDFKTGSAYVNGWEVLC